MPINIISYSTTYITLCASCVPPCRYITQYRQTICKGHNLYSFIQYNIIIAAICSVFCLLRLRRNLLTGIAASRRNPRKHAYSNAPCTSHESLYATHSTVWQSVSEIRNTRIDGLRLNTHSIRLLYRRTVPRNSQLSLCQVVVHLYACRKVPS